MCGTSARCWTSPSSSRAACVAPANAARHGAARGAADGYPLWSERFDRRLEDVFAIQDEIAQSVAGALRVCSPRGTQRAQAPSRRARGPTSCTSGGAGCDGRRDVRAPPPLFGRAIELDPDYAHAHAGLAEVSRWLCSWSGADGPGGGGRREPTGRSSRRRSSPKTTSRRGGARLAARTAAAVASSNPRSRSTRSCGRPTAVRPHALRAGAARRAERLWAKATAARPEEYQVPSPSRWSGAVAPGRRRLEATQWQGIGWPGASSRSTRGTSGRCISSPARSSSAGREGAGPRALRRVRQGRPVGALQRGVRLRAGGRRRRALVPARLRALQHRRGLPRLDRARRRLRQPARRPSASRRSWRGRPGD